MHNFYRHLMGHVARQLNVLAAIQGEQQDHYPKSTTMSSQKKIIWEEMDNNKQNRKGEKGKARQ